MVQASCITADDTAFTLGQSSKSLCSRHHCGPSPGPPASLYRSGDNCLCWCSQASSCNLPDMLLTRLTCRILWPLACLQETTRLFYLGPGVHSRCPSAHRRSHGTAPRSGSPGVPSHLLECRWVLLLCARLFPRIPSAVAWAPRMRDLLLVIHKLCFLGSKITADGLLLGRRAMTNPDRILKSRDISFPTKVHLIKAMVFQ